MFALCKSVGELRALFNSHQPRNSTSLSTRSDLIRWFATNLKCRAIVQFLIWRRLVLITWMRCLRLIKSFRILLVLLMWRACTCLYRVVRLQVQPHEPWDFACRRPSSASKELTLCSPVNQPACLCMFTNLPAALLCAGLLCSTSASSMAVCASPLFDALAGRSHASNRPSGGVKAAAERRRASSWRALNSGGKQAAEMWRARIRRAQINVNGEILSNQRRVLQALAVFLCCPNVCTLCCCLKSERWLVIA